MRRCPRFHPRHAALALAAALGLALAPRDARAQATVLDTTPLTQPGPTASDAVSVSTAPTGEHVTTWRPLAAGQGRLRVAVNRPNTDVHIDDQLAGDAPLERDLPAGIHRVRVTSPGQKAWEGTVEVTAGDLVPLRVFLRPSQNATGAWATMSVAAAIFGGSAAAGVLSNANRAALDTSRAAGQLDDGDPRIDAGAALAAAADVGFVLGGVMASIAIYMFAHDATPPSIARTGRRHHVPGAPR